MIRALHDFNDREPDGTYSVQLRKGTLVELYDEEGTRVRGHLVHDLFVAVRPSWLKDGDAGGGA